MCEMCDRTAGVEDLNVYDVTLVNDAGAKTTEFRGTSDFHAALACGAMLVTNFVLNMFPYSLTGDERATLIDFVGQIKSVNTTLSVVPAS